MSASPERTDVATDERLRLLEVVTDANLAHLDVEALLDELLVRVRELLAADTAAVLLVDRAGQFLNATAACGIEEEVHQGVRIPLGRGFAGRVAQDKHVVAIEKVDHANVLNPILREKGIVSLLGAPLIAAGTVLGVVHVGWLGPRKFTEQDASLLQTVADRIALATQARVSRSDRAAAEVMQRSLLPARLPELPGLELASRYVPGNDGAVGGDWFDVFALPGGTVCMVTGDVVGHGLPAALAMGHIRSVLRCCALQTDDPAELLGLVDAHIRHFQPDTMATVLCAMLDPSLQRLRLSSAGHPPPILARPQRPTVLADVPPDVPLGVADRYPRRTTLLTVEPGAVLCFYTDGLVERRTASVDDGLELLRSSVHPEPAETVCAKVMRRLIGTEIAEDDVAVLVLRRDPAF